MMGYLPFSDEWFFYVAFVLIGGVIMYVFEAIHGWITKTPGVDIRDVPCSACQFNWDHDPSMHRCESPLFCPCDKCINYNR